jgi:mannose/fructose/N-acetylgalactosamine-specific phosphotransferase system component IIB
LIEETVNNIKKRSLLCKELFVILSRPRYKYFIEANYSFKQAVLAKLGEFTNGNTLHKTINVPKDDAMEISRIARTVKKILMEKTNRRKGSGSNLINNKPENWYLVK